METTPVVSKIKIHMSMKENRLMASRFKNCQKQTAPRGNSSIRTRAVTRRGFIPSGVSVCFGLAVTLRRIKRCFVAAVSCPSACSPLCMLCTVQHVEGEIKVKATSTGSCSAGTVPTHGAPLRNRSSCRYSMHVNARSLFCQSSTVMDESAREAHGGSEHEAFLCSTPTEQWAPQWNKIPSQNGNDRAKSRPTWTQYMRQIIVEKSVLKHGGSGFVFPYTF